MSEPSLRQPQQSHARRPRLAPVPWGGRAAAFLSFGSPRPRSDRSGRPRSASRSAPRSSSRSPAAARFGSMRGRVTAFIIVGTRSRPSRSPASRRDPHAAAGFTALLNAATPLSRRRSVSRPAPGSPLAVAPASRSVSCGRRARGLVATRPDRHALAVAAGLGAPASMPSPALRPGAADRRRAARTGDGMVLAGALVALPVAILTGAPGTPTSTASFRSSRSASCRPRWPGRSSSGSSRRTTPTAASTVTFIVPAFAAAWGGSSWPSRSARLIVGSGSILVSLMLVLNLTPTIPRPAVRRLIAVLRPSPTA